MLRLQHAINQRPAIIGKLIWQEMKNAHVGTNVRNVLHGHGTVPGRGERGRYHSGDLQDLHPHEGAAHPGVSGETGAANRVLLLQQRAGMLQQKVAH